MGKEAQPSLRLAPTCAIFPGATVALPLLGCNLLEASLRDLLDLKTCGQR